LGIEVHFTSVSLMFQQDKYILDIRFLLAYISLIALPLIYMVLWMLITLIVLMIVSLRVDILSFFSNTLIS
jgi:hypothetical protein